MRTIESLLRPNIARLKPYSTARDEYRGSLGQFMDANENPFQNGINRYPDPYQKILKERISELKRVSADSVFIGNGSDEAIDILYRIFCIPATDNVISISPSYGMYKVAADINDTEFREFLLDDAFQLNAAELIKLADDKTKLIFLCSPNNPSGNLLDFGEIEYLLKNFDGIVIVDEAYIDFANTKSLTSQIEKYPNLVVLQTLSKAWGAAAIRLGIALANPDIIKYMTRVKYPYNINILSQKAALEALDGVEDVEEMIKMIKQERDQLRQRLSSFPFIEYVYPSDANFLLIKCFNSRKLYDYLLKKGIIVRDRSSVPGCNSCLRISIGTPGENQRLIEQLLAYEFLL
ncbi:MAG: histidinol-phosphate transaminase [Bacteroidales bacterium]